MSEHENQYKPDAVTHPGETLLETIQTLGMSQAELAQKTGIPQEDIELVVAGDMAISRRMARRLAKVLNIPFSFWVKRQFNYNEFLEREAFGGHRDVYIEVDGQPHRVFGDPNMSQETKEALAKVIQAAIKADADGDFDDDKESK